jgi:acetyl esterase
MTLDPQAEKLLIGMKEVGAKSFAHMTVPEARLACWNFVGPQGTPEPVAHVDDRFIPGSTADLPVRIYYPDGDGPFPALVYFHGGGWVVFNIGIIDATSRSLANRTGCAIVAVNYQKAPEHKFPIPLDDAVSATDWVAENAPELNIDSSRLGVMGDSAGGNLAAVVAIMARDNDGPALACQVLLYPPTDADVDKPSYLKNAEGYALERRDMQWFYEHYLNRPDEGNDPRVSPLRTQTLSGLPPALVVTNEYDPLRDDGRLYAAKLQADGTPTTYRDYPGLIHGILNMRGVVDASTTMHDDIGTWVRHTLSLPASQGKGASL